MSLSAGAAPAPMGLEPAAEHARAGGDDDEAEEASPEHGAWWERDSEVHAIQIEQARREGPSRAGASSSKGLRIPAEGGAQRVELHVRTAFAQPSPCCLKKLHAPPNPPITRTRLLHRSAARQPPTSTARRRIPHPAIMYPALKGCSRRPSRARRSTQ